MQLNEGEINSLSLLHIPKDMRTTDKLFIKDGRKNTWKAERYLPHCLV